MSQFTQDDTQLLRPPPASGADEPRTLFLDAFGQPLAPAPAIGAPQVEIGSILQERFKLIELIGVGGMSRVYKAIDLRRVEARSQNPFLAVKVLTVPFDHYSESIQALDREAHKLQSLTHPNIVRVIDVDRDEHTVFMTMEYLSGESLQDLLRQHGLKGLPRVSAEHIVTGIASALEFAHHTGIVHGDLKPGNVIITEANEVKVIDFGIARFFARHRDGAPPEQNVELPNALTPPYASPEMLEAQDPDPRDDVYALACIAHEVLTGEHPFKRMSSVEAREAGAKLERNELIATHQLKAIANGLLFERRHRTESAHAFIEQFCGKRQSQSKRWWLPVAAAVVAVAIIYFMQFARDGAAPTQPATPLTVGQVFRDCATCPLMIALPGGNFIQGSAAESAEQPPHPVTIAAPLAFAPREVTIGEFEEFAIDADRQILGCNVYDGEWRWRDDISWDTLDDAHTAQHPVSCVSWDDASAYAAWLSNKTGQTYRLPSASEWEYAASAGTTAATPLGVDLDAACKGANVADEAAAQKYPGWNVLGCNDRYAQSAPVASFSANAFNLHDMIGNVFEWVEDCWNVNYDNAPGNGTARTDGNCASREMRGGSWFTSPAYLRASYRNHFDRNYRSSSVGFRVVREIPR